MDLHKCVTVAALAVATAVVVGGAAWLQPAAAAAPLMPSVGVRDPLPQDPAPDIPTADQLLGILNAAQDPAVPFSDKSYLVEGGLSPVEARLADARMRQAVADGELPLTGTVADIRSAGPLSVTADVTVSGPKLTPVTQNLTFVKQGSWKLSRSSLLLLMQETSATGS